MLQILFPWQYFNRTKQALLQTLPHHVSQTFIKLIYMQDKVYNRVLFRAIGNCQKKRKNNNNSQQRVRVG